MLIYILFCIVNTLFIITLIDIILMGYFKIALNSKLNKDEAIVHNHSYFEMQGECECAAFSSAYLLRFLGKDVKGFDLYNELPKKYVMKNGAVYPKGVIYLLSEYGIKADYCRGNLKALLNEVTKGHPVIVLIKTFENKSWLHYSTIVGYDKDYIYLADSYKPLINCKEDISNEENSNEAIFNRRITKQEFTKLWNTRQLKMPLYKNTFYRIKETNL